MGPGCAFIDYDNDGNPDILLVNGKDFPGHKIRRTTPKLYHNNGNGTFTDVTAKAGLDVEMYGMGVAVGDYDNDGWDDIYVTGLGEARLFHNEHNGTFKDVTQAAGVNNTGFGASAAWVDYDKDGKLDLFVTNYVKWSEKDDLYCTLDGRHKSYCTPEAYKGDTRRLFHNLGNGRFEDVTQKAGIYDPTSKSLGVAVIDYDLDGWPDLAVSNDTERNKLYHNNHNGTFTEQAVQAGIAFSEDGIARGAMGIDASGLRPLRLSQPGHRQLLQPDARPLPQRGQPLLYRHRALFVGGPRQPALALLRPLLFRLRPRRPRGYVRRQRPHRARHRAHPAAGDLRAASPGVSQRRPRQVSGNRQAARASRGSFVARGAAHADIDNDGAPDILLTTNGGPAYLFHNVGRQPQQRHPHQDRRHALEPRRHRRAKCASPPAAATTGRPSTPARATARRANSP